MQRDLFKKQFYAYAVWNESFMHSPYTLESDNIQRVREWANREMTSNHGEFAYVVVCERVNRGNIEIGRVYYDKQKEIAYERGLARKGSAIARGSK